MRLVIISDIHNAQWNLKLPAGDVLIVAGDLTCRGGFEEYGSVDNWLGQLPYRDKIVIGGNHDTGLQENPFLIKNAKYLHNERYEVGGVKFYGTGYNNTPGDRWAFNDPNDVTFIPDSDVDVLITHCPPYGIMDFWGGRHGGDGRLLDKVLALKPKIHCFGHIHEWHDIIEKDGIKFVGAAIQDEKGVMIRDGKQIREAHVLDI